MVQVLNGSSDILPGQGVLSNSLKEVLAVHHNSTPQRNISSHRVGDISDNESRDSLLDVSLAIRWESDNVHVGTALVDKRHQDGGGAVETLHVGTLV